MRLGAVLALEAAKLRLTRALFILSPLQALAPGITTERWATDYKARTW